MPDYGVHKEMGKVVGRVIAVFIGLLILFQTFDPVMTVFAMILAYSMTIVGGVIPDIDLSQPQRTLKYASKPYKKFKDMVFFLLSIAAFVILGFINQSGINATSAVYSMAVICGLVVAFRFLPDFLHEIMPKHRGILHSMAPWVFFVVSAVGVTISLQDILYWQNAPAFLHTYIPLIVGLSVLSGVFTHIATDSLDRYARQYIPDTVRSDFDYPPWVPRRIIMIPDFIRIVPIIFKSKTPGSIRLLGVITIGYMFVPFDVISDILPIVGWLDDMTIYLYLKHTIYIGYHENLSISDVLDRDVMTIIKITLPVLVLSVISIYLYFKYLT